LHAAQKTSSCFPTLQHFDTAWLFATYQSVPSIDLESAISNQLAKHKKPPTVVGGFAYTDVFIIHFVLEE
tara:strand:+ start:1107 stop:1316 length:210 start_codon:yes stop_codon:yes gene_type:complete